MPTTFTGPDFIKALSGGGLKEPIILLGMVKPDEGCPGSLLFAEGTCSNWIKIPESLIEEVEFLTTIKCRDHEHPFVKICLKEPPEENETAQVFAQLLRTKQNRQNVSTMPHAHRNMAISRQFGGTGQLPGGNPPIVHPMQQPTGNNGSGTGPGDTSGCPCIQTQLECRVVTVNFPTGGGRSMWFPMVECEYVCVRRDCRSRE